MSSVSQNNSKRRLESCKASNIDPIEFGLRKRLPPSLPKRPTDVYITLKTDFKVRLEEKRLT